MQILKQFYDLHIASANQNPRGKTAVRPGRRWPTLRRAYTPLFRHAI